MFVKEGKGKGKKKKKMVVARGAAPQVVNEKIRTIQLPIIDFMGERSEVSKLMVKACQDFGFFKLVNHGVPNHIISPMEDQSWNFFSKTSSEKETTFGYGCKNIGFNGDVGDVEYLILNANRLSHQSPLTNYNEDPTTKFRSVFLLVMTIFYISLTLV